MKSRYPRFTEAESAFGAAVGRMKLDERCRVSAPKYFEGSEISVTIRAENTEQLTHILSTLSSVDAENGFRQLFSIIKGGEGS